MNDILSSTLAIILAYLFGSMPIAYLLGRWIKRFDIRQVGTHNMGAMNAFYEVGFLPGLIVLIVDIGKGALGVAVARVLGTPELVQLVCGLMVILGHNYPVWLSFHGGKGGAAVIGVLAFLMPQGIPWYVGMFLLVLAITRFPTLSYSVAFAVFPFVGWLIYHSGLYVFYTFIILAIPGSQYLGRAKQIGQRSRSFKDAVFRKSIKDRR